MTRRNQRYEIEGLPRLRDLIKDRREELRMTQPQLAKAAGLGSAELVSMVEHGIRRISLGKVIDLATALRINAKICCAWPWSRDRHGRRSNCSARSFSCICRGNQKLIADASLITDPTWMIA